MLNLFPPNVAASEWGGWGCVPARVIILWHGVFVRLHSFPVRALRIIILT